MLPKNYKVELLDSSLTPITQVKALVPLNKEGYFLEYSNRLSDYGKAKFRVSVQDPLFDAHGDIIQPYANHVRITRDNAIVWQGVIVNNSRRTSQYIEVEAYEYLFLLTKVGLRHDTNGDTNYRTFNSGTMATAIQTVLTEAKADAGNILANIEIGTIENPTFPQGFVDVNNTSLAGQQWTFSNNFVVKYDYRDVLYVLQSFGLYAVSDFELAYNSTTNKLTFNFKKFLGTRKEDVMFDYNAQIGSIEDFDVPRLGERMANQIVGVAADNQFTILKVDYTDDASIKTYGKLWGVAAYADVKSKNLLIARLREEGSQISTPDSEMNIVLNERAYPLGVYRVGDIITVQIKHHIIDVKQARRVVGIDVKVHNTGKERIRVYTNKPRPEIA